VDNKPPSTEVAAIEQVLGWFLRLSTHRHMTIRSDSTSAIARAQHEGAGPGQGRAVNIQSLVRACRRAGKTTDIVWVKGYEGTPGNERADVLAGKAAEKLSHSRVVSPAHLKLQISEKFRTTKTTWDTDQRHHGTEAIPPPPPKKSCPDKMRNALARTAAQIRTGHWRSAVYLKRIRKRADDNCWTGKDDALAYSTPLPKRETPVGENGGVGREEPRGCPGVVSQSQVGKAVCPFLRIVWGGEDDG